MGSRGPVPKPEGEAINQQVWSHQIWDGVVRGPDLFDCPTAIWHPLVLAFYEYLRRDAMSMTWTQTDWSFAQETCWVKELGMRGSISALGEARQRAQLLGVTPDQKRRLRTIIDAPPADPIEATGTDGSPAASNVSEIGHRRRPGS
jgi:hypothetical protein